MSRAKTHRVEEDVYGEFDTMYNNETRTNAKEVEEEYAITPIPSSSSSSSIEKKEWIVLKKGAVPKRVPK